MNTEILDTFLPHARCSQALRTRVDRVAKLFDLKPGVLVRDCVEFVLDGLETGEYVIIEKENIPDARSGSDELEE